ncbi:DNA repair protein RadA [Bdellovibrio svalbardensis]|uniref:DNA repair protein RadA n=1 Tax=Bdellovibrio svalbardensis TaxID=2972972 RepID=A0ABT6DGE6_9BACT|nr:DNA repair protein RadA [Bdellovibrio svalbardensis]MDG0815905.1 DNA repair protein RadA [Bdellovibrio svalbardensis]
MAKSKTKTIYTCQNCGAQRPRWEGKCSDCGAWNSYVEELQLPEVKTRGWSTGGTDTASTANKPVSLDQRLEEIKLDRFDTGFEELNRVLGGGLARGSFVLLGGSPGIGKSTLLLQMAGGLADHKHKVLYISGEESVSQTGSRAHRLGIRSPLIEIGCESNLHNVMELARHKKPDVLVVDSIQTMYLSDLQAAPGSVSQVRECAGHLMGLAKHDNITVILIGHVTKDGNIAGPKVLEHMVDCVLSFDGDISYDFRLLRALKNRFGAAQELGVFQMNSKGLEEVSNPSELFLGERGDQLIGSAVFASMEGTRPLLCEVQALTLSSPMPMPRRTALGIDVNRLHLLTAVLDRHLDIRLGNNDIFINVVGGLKLIEPAADLAVAAAILSTESRRDLDAHTCYFGEIGLTGEVRGVSFVEARVKEADKLGFKHFVMPLSNKRHLADIKISKDKKISFVKNVHELRKLI